MFVKVVRCAFLVVIRRFKLSGQYMRKIEVRGRRDKGGSRNGLKVKWTPTYVYSTESMPVMVCGLSLIFQEHPRTPPPAPCFEY
jgi:hypothetical protein